MKIRKEPIKVLGPLGDEKDVQAVREVILSGWWGKGPKVSEFEQRFAKLVGAKHAIAVTSNSHGQDLVMKALGITGVDVISPTMSFVATAVIPLWNNCTSNLVDVDRKTLNITAEQVKLHSTENTKACVVVNMAGVPADIDSIREVFDGIIIEDCAHSCYTEGAGMKGDIAVWSFQAVKTMPAGDGGMITLNDDELAKKIRSLLWFGVSSTWSRTADDSGNRPGYAWDYNVTDIGYKYYMTDIIAALAMSQLDKLGDMLEHRRNIQSRYNAELHPVIEKPPHSETCQYYIARLPVKQKEFDGMGYSTVTRDDMIEYLAHKKIHTSVHFKPLHHYSILKDQNKEFPVADSEWVKLITLPCHNGLTDDDLDYVIYWVNKFITDCYL